ncbi:MAG: aminofutalosine synthase MqnE [Bacteroidales bacterium]|nr:aminofutalosine synthase MqnE [Bacteroidales bacterium]
MDNSLRKVFEKVIEGERITVDEAMELFRCDNPGLLGAVANGVKEKMHGEYVFFNRNLHIEPTNICIYNCTFCTYSKKQGEEGCYEASPAEIVNKICELKHQITEVHIVGGVHPDFDLEYYCSLFKSVKEKVPHIIIKALTAIELDYIFAKAGIGIKEGLQKLKESGLDAIPGGGAEIFDEGIREKVCKDKASSRIWLSIHEEAHKLGISTNATMLFGHIENIEHRIDHLNRLRQLQDLTKGFNAFIPLQFRNFGNNIIDIEETAPHDVLKTFAISRIFLDNIPHIKAYWPDIGKPLSQIALSFGADDLDGTVDNTRIYTQREDEKLKLAEQELVRIIRDAGKTPVERDTNYNILRIIKE